MRLTLLNWKIHKDLTIDFDADVDLVLGLNGSGKTALNDAVEFVLLGTGKLAGISRKSELGSLVISDGADSCGVFLRFDEWSVTRSMDRAGKQTIKLQKSSGPMIDGKLRDQQQLLDSLLDVEEGQVRAVLDARMLLEGPENDRRAVLFGASGIEATEGDVIAAFAQHGLDGEDVRVAAQDVRMQGWRTAETLAGERRAALKRELAELTVPEPQHLFRHSALDAEKDSVDLRRCPLTMLDKKRETNAEALADALKSAGMDVGKAAEALRAKRAECERTYGEADILKKQAAADRPVMGLLELTLSTTSSEHKEAVEGHDACTAAREKIGDPISLTKLDKPKICPAIPGDFECPVTPTRLDKHRTKLQGTADDRAAAIEHADEQVELALARLNPARTARQEAQAALDAEKTLVHGLARLNEQCERLDDEVDDLAADHQKAEEAAATGGNPAFHQKRLDATLETIEARHRYDDVVAALERHEATVAGLEEKRGRADMIAQLLKPTGLETMLLAGLVGPLQAKLDEVGQFVGAMRITAELDVELVIGGVWRHFSQLSESQRERVAVAVQHAVASLAGFPLLIVDRIDHLDPMGKSACMKALASVSSQYQAVLALATLQGRQPTKAKAAGVTTWHLAGGDVVRVE